MPRQARLDYPGTLHHVMVRGIEWEDGRRKMEAKEKMPGLWRGGLAVGV